MWISIDSASGDGEQMYLPKSLAVRIEGQVNISFGKKTVSAKVEPSGDDEVPNENSFENPMKIAMSETLINRLQIPEPLVYQMILHKNNIEIGPVIGLLMGNRNHLYTPHHMEKYSDRFGVYKEVGGLIYSFSPNSIDWEHMQAYGLFYNIKKEAWEYGRFPLPAVVYRRDFHSGPEPIKRLVEITNGKLFNSWRFSKYYLYQYIKENRELSQYLPPTELLRSFEQARNFIDRYKKIILKPVSLSRGRGICFITKQGAGYKIEDYRVKPTSIKILKDEIELKRFFDQNRMFFSIYIAQRFLSLARIDGSPFDIRIVMQKNVIEKWRCSGIECRVANNGSLLTNISRGGYALTIDEALARAFPDGNDYGILKRQLYNLCGNLCSYMDRMGQHFAEFGMDIAIDENKRFWVIEINVFPSFKGFKKMDYETYLKIRYTPILYATHLAGFDQSLRGEKRNE